MKRRGTVITAATAGAFVIAALVGVAGPANATGTHTWVCWGPTGHYTGTSTIHSANTTSSTTDCHDTNVSIQPEYSPYGSPVLGATSIAPGHFVSQNNPGYAVDYAIAGEQEDGTFFYSVTP